MAYETIDPRQARDYYNDWSKYEKPMDRGNEYTGPAPSQYPANIPTSGDEFYYVETPEQYQRWLEGRPMQRLPSLQGQGGGGGGQGGVNVTINLPGGQASDYMQRERMGRGQEMMEPLVPRRDFPEGPPMSQPSPSVSAPQRGWGDYQGLNAYAGPIQSPPAQSQPAYQDRRALPATLPGQNPFEWQPHGFGMPFEGLPPGALNQQQGGMMPGVNDIPKYNPWQTPRPLQEYPSYSR